MSCLPPNAEHVPRALRVGTMLLFGISLQVASCHSQ
jgi:hypothetical protein